MSTDPTPAAECERCAHRVVPGCPDCRPGGAGTATPPDPVRDDELAAGLRLTVAAQVRQLGVFDAARRASDALVDSLRSQVAASEARLNSALATGDEPSSANYLRDTLALIAENGCEVSSRGTPCYESGSGRDRVSTTGTADQWCDSCRAAHALAAATPGEPPERSRAASGDIVPGDWRYDRLAEIVHTALFYEDDSDGPIFRWSDRRLASDDDGLLKAAADAVVCTVWNSRREIIALLAMPAPGEPSPPAEIRAPFTETQQQALYDWQNSSRVHPFTCPEGHGELAVGRHWYCTECDYTQYWAHAFMADPVVRPLLSGGEQQ